MTLFSVIPLPMSSAFGPGNARICAEWPKSAPLTSLPRRLYPHQQMSVQELEGRWVEAAKEGDQAAFANLVRAHQGRVIACTTQMLGRRPEAEDAAQEAFVRAWRFLHKFDGRSKFSTWIYRIAVNVCLNHLRKRSNHEKPAADEQMMANVAADRHDFGVDPGKALEQGQLREQIVAAVEGLSPALRAAAVLVLLGGMPHSEAAEVLECAEGTVAWRVHEARRKLREALADVVGAEAKKKRSAS